MSNNSNKGLTHKRKKSLARRMMTRQEIVTLVSPFNSKWWSERKERIQKKIEGLSK